MAPRNSTRKKYKKTVRAPDPLKPRSLRSVIFNSKAPSGLRLTPKQAVLDLRERKAVLQYQVHAGDGVSTNSDTYRKYMVVQEELHKAENFMRNEARRAKNNRKKGQSPLATVTGIYEEDDHEQEDEQAHDDKDDEEDKRNEEEEQAHDDEDDEEDKRNEEEDNDEDDNNEEEVRVSDEEAKIDDNNYRITKAAWSISSYFLGSSS